MGGGFFLSMSFAPKYWIAQIRSEIENVIPSLGGAEESSEALGLAWACARFAR